MRILSVVIPAYNEEDGIAPILERVLKVKRAVQKSPSAIEDVEVIVVNDASQDRTCDIASSYPDVTVITHSQNKGYGGALKTGFAAAKGEWIGFLDADGTYPPEEFPALCEAMVSQDADMVIGSRMTGAKSGMPIRRYIGNKFFAYLLSWIVGSAITDTASGQRVFKRTILAQLLPLPDGLHLTPAMSTAALHEGLNIIEVPIRYDNRVGHSKLHIVSDGFRFLNIIIRTARLYNPLKFFGVVGLALLAIGCFLSVEPITYYLDVRSATNKSGALRADEQGCDIRKKSTVWNDVLNGKSDWLKDSLPLSRFSKIQFFNSIIKNPLKPIVKNKIP